MVEERTRRAVLVGADTARLLALAGELEARGLEVALYRDADRGVAACDSGQCDVLVAIGRLAPRDGVPPQRVAVPLVLLDAPDAPDLALRPIGPRTGLGATVAPGAAADRVIALLARAPDLAAARPPAETQPLLAATTPPPPPTSPPPPAPPVAATPPPAVPPLVAMPPASPPPVASGPPTAPPAARVAPPVVPQERAPSEAGLSQDRGAAISGAPQDWGGSAPAASRPAPPSEPGTCEPEASRAVPSGRGAEPARTTPPERGENVHPTPAAERPTSPERPLPASERFAPSERATPANPAARAAEPAAASGSGESASGAPPWWEQPPAEPPPEPAAAAAAHGPAERLSSLRRTITDDEEARRADPEVARTAARPAPRRGGLFSSVLFILAGLALGLAAGFIVLGLFGMR